MRVLDDFRDGSGAPAFGVALQDAAPDGSRLPLCVDLDGTLTRTDIFVEGLVTVLTSRLGVVALPRLLTADRADLKRRVAALVPFDAALLPYNEDLLTYLREQRSIGRWIVLATAADALVAHAVARHLNLFDEVICSDGVRNLRGEAKARALVERFGQNGFVYVGNDRSDLPIWRAAHQAIAVGAPRAVRRELLDSRSLEREFDAGPSRLRAALRAMRPHQWAKNALVFAPMILGHAATDPVAWQAAFLMFLAFCATASAIYIVNDLTDLAADRQHPRKRHRPFASGSLSPLAGIGLAALLFLVGFTLSLPVGASLVIVVYAAISLSYSAGLKEYPIVDVFLLAGLYTIRILGGGLATGELVSLWLIAFSGFLFLALALVKRTEEMTAVTRSAEVRIAARRGYFPDDADTLRMFGCASSFASSVVLALFVGSDEALRQYATPELLWAIVPLLLFWQCRLWLSTARGHMHDDPIVYATRDWVSWAVAGCAAALFAAATLDVPLSSVGIMHR